MAEHIASGSAYLGAVFVCGEADGAFTESDEALMRLFKLQAAFRPLAVLEHSVPIERISFLRDP